MLGTCTSRLLRTMTTPARISALALTLLTLAAPAAASSTASSAVSDSIGATVGSVSDSVQGSSNASSPQRRDKAEGRYRITEVAAVAGRPEALRLGLRGLDEGNAGQTVQLVLPRAALGGRGLEAGAEVLARARPYGIEFSVADTREPFFLGLHDAWRRELAPRPVTL